MKRPHGQGRRVGPPRGRNRRSGTHWRQTWRCCMRRCGRRWWWQAGGGKLLEHLETAAIDFIRRHLASDAQISHAGCHQMYHCRDATWARVADSTARRSALLHGSLEAHPIIIGHDSRVIVVCVCYICSELCLHLLLCFGNFVANNIWGRPYLNTIYTYI
jgi:hypothetical protein